ncbi:tRNA(Ile)(2)-agmatinylcytidine synthase, partial [Candidatus Bathyarchaeota archaeon]|nr:tRNA(Ile)(2)-agmatinylcytidine synthase [Candidatus Bathyarchaeota archaeon]
RGNAALCLRLSLDEERIGDVKETVVDTVEEMSQLNCPRTDPGIVFWVGDVPSELSSFARRTIQDIVSKKEALDVLRHFGGEAIAFKSGRGIIGALAAVGETLSGDHTFELIAYRTAGNRGKTPRRVDPASVFQMDKEMSRVTFNNVDYEKRRILITPRGADPVLLGIRGENPIDVKKAYQMITVLETPERWVIFRTNQGTDAHLRRVAKIAGLQPYRPVIVEGTVSVQPHYIPGKHLIFSIDDDSARIDCAAYEPSGKFRRIVEKLIIGDYVEVSGGMRPQSQRNPPTLNIEKMRIITLASKRIPRNPVCIVCGKHMESMGRGQGFRCKKCGFRLNDAVKISSELVRNLQEGLYIPPPRANRHLTKPMSRDGLEKVSVSSVPLNFWGLGGTVS